MLVGQMVYYNPTPPPDLLSDRSRSRERLNSQIPSREHQMVLSTFPYGDICRLSLSRSSSFKRSGSQQIKRAAALLLEGRGKNPRSFGNWSALRPDVPLRD